MVLVSLVECLMLQIDEKISLCIILFRIQIVNLFPDILNVSLLTNH